MCHFVFKRVLLHSTNIKNYSNTKLTKQIGTETKSTFYNKYNQYEYVIQVVLKNQEKKTKKKNKLTSRQHDKHNILFHYATKWS